MKDSTGSIQLYPNEQVAHNVTTYAVDHSTKLPKEILDVHADTSKNHQAANYMISPLQAQFQLWMAKALGAKRILEIGCFVGFSALGWAKAVGKDGQVTTLEFSEEYAQTAKDNLAKHEVENVEVIVGDAKESLKTLPGKTDEPYDLIFIDADKVSYPAYLSTILTLSSPNSASPRILKPGGIIIADNVLRRGLIADSSDANPFAVKMKTESNALWRDNDMKALDEFNKQMVNEPRLETFLMPLFDGVSMARLVD